MSVLRPTPGPHPVHVLHRISARSVGAFLILFALLGLFEIFTVSSTTDYTSVLGLSCNGLLSAVSLLTGVVLVFSSLCSGPIASATSIALGAIFLLSGVTNLMLLDGTYNPFAFTVPNVVFSIAVGLLLLSLGAYGRISAALPPGNPYRTAPDPGVRVG